MTNLPPKLRFLDIDSKDPGIETLLEWLPFSLEFLSIQSYCKKKIDNLPPKLKYLGCGPHNILWREIPDSLRVIDLRQSYKGSIKKLQEGALALLTL
jgi:hypothetical protein